MTNDKLKANAETRTPSSSECLPPAVLSAPVIDREAIALIAKGVTPGAIEKMVVSAMDTARLEAIEECAKVADTAYLQVGGYAIQDKRLCQNIAKAIRSLTAQPSGREGGFSGCGGKGAGWPKCPH